MWLSLLELIVCPGCGGGLRLEDSAAAGEDEVLTGRLACTECEAHFPIVRGVPRLIAGIVEERSRTTIDGFGWQWNHFSTLLSQSEQQAQFLDWIEPLEHSDFADKIVLDVGCGMGRMTEVAAGFKPKHLIAIDASSAVEAAWARLRGRKNVHVVQADVHALPLRRGGAGQIELAYSVGVLHHLPEPERGFRCVLEHLAPGGRQFGWVYGAEGNGWIRTFVDPVRTHVTSRLDPRVLLGLAHSLAGVLYTTARVVRRVGAENRVPAGAYLSWLARWPYRHCAHVVHDHLGPAIAYYIAREELEGWFERASVRVVEITPRNENSWRFLVETPSP